MVNYIFVEVKCPCGKLLEKRRSNAESNSTTRGSRRCPRCKKMVRYEVTGGRVNTNYE